MRRSERQHWLWVVGPEYYLDGNGQERAELDPAHGTARQGWWTCHRDTRFGDLALIYRTAPRKDIAYLARAESDAFATVDGPGSTGYACDYTILARFDPPFPLAQLRADPALAGWPALKVSFRGAAHRVPRDLWSHLLARLPIRPTTLDRLVEQRGREYGRETEIEQHFVDEPRLIRKTGQRLRYVRRQHHFRGGGIADLIYRAPLGRTVVVELKAEPVAKGAVRQLLEYLGSVSAESRHPLRPHGILIGPNITPDAQAVVDALPNVRFLALARFGLHRRLPDPAS